jgi:aryl-alcohol dehydrogenase-like predicted oxidoreductase
MELRHTGNPNRPDLDNATAGALLNTALDSGITYFDTSPTYGPAEELIGEFLAGRREEFTLSTKTGFVVDELPARRHVFTKDVVRKGLEWSLRRLKTDYVDLVQLPGSPSPAELIELGTLEELEAMRAEGKCRFIGISGWSPGLQDHLNWGAFDVYQIPYSALERDNENLISEAARADVGTVVRGGVAQGSVSDEKSTPVIGDDRHGHDQEDQKLTTWNAASLDDLLDGSSRGDFMIRFLLSNPSINTSIIGTSNMSHLQANILAARLGPLPSEIYLRAQQQLTGK